mmetsp:Transcript_23522/g.23264  ORF Transcript_23522/g.23264 Transcript_23522/m.23264 type:complete len:191 (+) Transcript_23522:44-616(+)
MYVRNSPFEDYGFKPEVDDDSDPPLLEDLGINPEHIKQKTFSVLTFTSVDERLLSDPDMAGPLLFVVIFGALLLFAGKVHFGYIYGFGLLGSFGIYAVINLMSQEREIDLYRTVSILGYSLLPIVLLAGIGVFFKLNGPLGTMLAIICVGWSTFTAAKFFESLLEMKDQKYLIMYPVCLMYACFTLLTVF